MVESRRSLRAEIERLEAGLRDYGDRILELERELEERDDVLRSHGIEARSLADVLAASSAGIERRHDQRNLKSYITAAGALVGYGAWFIAGTFGGLQGGSLSQQVIDKIHADHPAVFICAQAVEGHSAQALGRLSEWEARVRKLAFHRVRMSGDGYELSGSGRAGDVFEARPGPEASLWRVTARNNGAQSKRFEVKAFQGADAQTDALAYLEANPDAIGALAIEERFNGPMPTSALLLRRAELIWEGV